jgi:hypothetical protein
MEGTANACNGSQQRSVFGPGGVSVRFKLPRPTRRGCALIAKVVVVGYLLFGLAMCTYAMAQYG